MKTLPSPAIVWFGYCNAPSKPQKEKKSGVANVELPYLCCSCGRSLLFNIDGCSECGSQLVVQLPA